MRTLHILKSEPDNTWERIIEHLTEKEEATVQPLFQGNVDWERLVDDIFAHDKVICWW